MEHYLSILTNGIWSLFLPILVIVSLLIWPKLLFKLKNKLTDKSKPTLKQSVGPIAISLGAMVGTGAIVGVLGAIKKLPAGVSPEAIAIWSLVGVVIMLPLIYVEVIVTKVMNMSPKQYISKLISPTAGSIYAISFMVLYVFGFGGFQFQGIKEVMSVVSVEQFNFEMNNMQSYLYIVIPLFIFSSGIILTKKHNLFISVLTVMIVVAVGAYFIFLLYFMYNSGEFVGVFLNNMVDEFLNPASAFLGLPVGLLLGLQRIIQTSEAGLGGLAMSSLESDSKPRAAAVIAMIPAIITIIIAILGTSFVASYGLTNNLVISENLNIASFIEIAYEVTGMFGVIVVMLFTVLSGLTTLIGSYYFIGILLNTSENKNIIIYMVTIFVAGTLAVFGAGIVFEIIDLLLFLVTTLNLIALYIFVQKGYVKYLKK